MATPALTPENLVFRPEFSYLDSDPAERKWFRESYLRSSENLTSPSPGARCSLVCRCSLGLMKSRI
jgi:hypothetical protein